VKLIDFGNSQIVGSATATGALGTTQYIAPELLSRKKYKKNTKHKTNTKQT